MRQVFVAIAMLTAFVAGGAIARGQTTMPSLAALDREVQQLFRDAQERTVRVIVPIHLPARLIEQEHPLARWGQQLDPKVREQLAAAARNDGNGMRVFVDPRAATTPATQPAQPSTQPAPQLSQEQNFVPLTPQTTLVNAEFIGLVLDARGDVLVPLFIDAAYQQGPLHVTVDDHRVTTATIVAADRQTSLTVVRLAQPAGQAVKFAQAKPAAGSLLLMMSPTRRVARLGVWSGIADDNAILVALDGSIAGIVRNGHALYPAMFGPVVDQLVRGEQVRRATLGVLIREIPADDPRRGQLEVLGSRPAARVDGVFANSAAARAGLRAGDLILSMGDQPVEDVATFAAAIANQRGPTAFRIIRDGKEMTVKVELQAQ